jgi:hypothetical protein
MVGNHHFTVGSLEIGMTETYRYLGITFSQDLSWDKEVAFRIKRAKELTGVWTRVLRNPHIPPILRRCVIQTYIMPAVTYGIELWGHNQELCNLVEASLATAKRMTVWANKWVRREAISWELGFVPLRVLSTAKSARLIIKWLNLPSELAHSFTWHRRILESSRFQWSWVDRAIREGNKMLGSDILRMKNDASNKETISRCMKASALDWYRKFFSTSKAANAAFLLRLHEHEDDLLPQTYLSSKQGGYGVSILVRLRTGTLRLNSVVSKFTSREPGCQSCNSCNFETPEHFLCHCPAYNGERIRWQDEADCKAGHDIRLIMFSSAGVLNSFSTALEGSPAFLGQSTDLQEIVKFENARTSALAQMWRVRSMRIASTAEVPSGVEAGCMTNLIPGYGNSRILNR